MHRWTRSLVLAGAAALALLTAGFYVFASSIRSHVVGSLPLADAVVVLTGGEDRIAAGVNLIAGGHGSRLLISGVHKLNSTARELGRRLGGDPSIYECCVDLGHGALDTIGNAHEAKEWAGRWGFRRLIVVTSAYHMPRSLVEFAHAMPGVSVYAYPVASRHFRVEEWWHHYPTARLLAGEYVKYLAAATRLSFCRLGRLLDRQPPPVPPRVARPQTGSMMASP